MCQPSLQALYTCTTAQVFVNTLDYNGKVYGTLDDVSVTSTSLVCQESYRSVPSGCTLAPDTSDIRSNVVGKYEWTTNCIILSGGGSYCTKQYGASAGASCGSTNYLSQSGSQYKPANCQDQVLFECPPGVDPGLRRGGQGN